LPLSPGTRLGTYEIHAQIGAGGMGGLSGDRHEAETSSKPGVEEWIGTFRPWRSRARGRLEAARQSARYAIELAAGAGRREPAAIFEAAAAVSAVTIRSS